MSGPEPKNPLRASKRQRTSSMTGDVSLGNVPTEMASGNNLTTGREQMALIESLLKKAEEFYRRGQVYDWNRNLTGALVQYSLAANTIVDVQQMIATFGEDLKRAVDRHVDEKLSSQNSIKWCENTRCMLDNGLRHILGKVKQLQDTLRQVKGAALWPVGQDKNQDDDEDCDGIAPFVPDEKACKNTWFSSIIGMQEQKDALTQLFIKPLLYPNMFSEVAKGLLLYGSPGTGKTLLVKAAINELNKYPEIKVLFYTPSAAELKGKYFGESEKNIKRLFRCAAKQACECQKANPNVRVISIIFLDEIESVGGDRSKDSTGFMGTTVNALLLGMDGIDSFANVSVVASTNLPWSLDSALLRRFTRRIHVPLPDQVSIQSLMEKKLSDLVDRIENPRSVSASQSCDVRFTKNTEPCPQTKCPPGSEQVVEITKWRESKNRQYFRYLSIAELSGHAVEFAKNNYSNSDIENLWSGVLTKIGEEGIRANAFIKVNDPVAKADRFISVLSATIPEIKQALAEKRLVTLENPENESILLAEKYDFVHQSLLPLVTYSHPRIKAIYVPKGSDEGITGDNTKNIPLLVQFEVFVEETIEDNEAEDLGKKRRAANDNFERLIAMRPQKANQLNVSRIDDLYILPNEQLVDFFQSYKDVEFIDGDNQKVNMHEVMKIGGVPGATRKETIFAVCIASRATFFKTLIYYSSFGKAGATSKDEFEERILNNIVLVFNDFGSPGNFRALKVDLPTGSTAVGEVPLLSKINPSKKLDRTKIVQALKTGRVSCKKMLRLMTGSNHQELRGIFSSEMLAKEGILRGSAKDDVITFTQVPYKITPYMQWSHFTINNPTFDKFISSIATDKSQKVIADALNESFEKTTDEEFSGKTLLKSVPFPTSLKSSVSDADQALWDELRKLYLPFSIGYKNFVRNTAINVLVTSQHIHDARILYPSSAVPEQIENLKKYAIDGTKPKQ
uniref:AAA-ATPase, SpoVK/Ycf46/Vps4 family n=1 Tax=Clandestinovirus TaxID=2831644 RepID=A0A8F8PM78_9VIRU|nr:AAA-ATPase, SpoVK/Ycf46/Vps4 family [Clandestinovirus]